MKRVFPIFDTETTGLPIWKEPSEGANQPHLVQLALGMFDENADMQQSLDVIIKPDGWEIHPDMTAIHGITTEMAHDLGIREKTAVEMLLDLTSGNREHIAFNRTFDDRIIRIALMRYFGEDVANEYKERPGDCAMIMAQKVMGGKRPTLEVAYEHFTGKPLVGAHNAWFDMVACKEVFFAARKAIAVAA